MFIENKYYNLYFSIIEKAKNSNRKKNKTEYFELHHIIPKCLNHNLANLNLHPENGVLLTAKEHILVHHLLCKFTTGKALRSCQRAYHAMCYIDNGGRNKRLTSLGQHSRAREFIKIANRGKRGIQGAPIWSQCNTLEEFKTKLTKLVNNHTSDPKIGVLFGVSAQTIHSWRNKLNITKRRENIRDQNWLFNEYIIKKKTADEIAIESFCSGAAIRQKLKKYGIPTRQGSEKYSKTRFNSL